jgi:thiamine kinase
MSSDPIEAGRAVPSAALRVEVARHVAADGPWRLLAGGRSNSVWQLGPDESAVICKLERQGRASDLFPNDPAAELAALTALSGSGLAPEPIAMVVAPEGRAVLYRHVAGSLWAGDPAEVGAALARLHRLPLPPGLRHVDTSAAAILAEGRRLGDLPAPQPPALMAPRPAFLHGDPVPANILATAGGPVLIDWQCPGIGDPAHDIAIFLSPGMHLAYGAAPLDSEGEAAFWRGYGEAGARASYHDLAPLLHWRLACYCQSRLAAGEADYGPALRAETERLKRL